MKNAQYDAAYHQAYTNTVYTVIEMSGPVARIRGPSGSKPIVAHAANLKLWRNPKHVLPNIVDQEVNLLRRLLTKTSTASPVTGKYYGSITKCPGNGSCLFYAIVLEQMRHSDGILRPDLIAPDLWKRKTESLRRDIWNSTGIWLAQISNDAKSGTLQGMLGA